MANPPSTPQNGAERHLVLIDFDWEDADLVPELLRRPGIRVSLVAGESHDDAGIRVAALCGVRRTLDLSDLTRHIFDLALVGERSARRRQVERLLTALGTPVDSPSSFLGRAEAEAASSPAPAEEGGPPALLAAGHAETPLLDLDSAATLTPTGAAPATPVEPGTGREARLLALEQALSQALPSLTELSFPGPPVAKDAPAEVPPVFERVSLGPIPTPADREGLARALGFWAAISGASSAEVVVSESANGVERLAHHGEEDRLLAALVGAAVAQRIPQVVTRRSGPGSGRTWGAWSFTIGERSVVLGAAGIDPDRGPAFWEQAAEALAGEWKRVPEPAAAPRAAPSHLGPVGPDALRTALLAALEGNRRDGLRYELHRLRFGGAPEVVETLAEALSGVLRATDHLCRPAPLELLLLCVGSSGSYTHVRRRLLAAWERSWAGSGESGPAPPIVDEFVELGVPEDAEEFSRTAGEWLTPRGTAVS